MMFSFFTAFRKSSRELRDPKLEEDDEEHEQLLDSAGPVSPSSKSRTSLSTCISLAFVICVITLIVPWRSLLDSLRFRYLPQSLVRKSNNLVYWTPQKTGSTSMRGWLRAVKKATGVQIFVETGAYPYSDKKDWIDRARLEVHHNLSAATTPQCSIVYGHIRMLPYNRRRDERLLGPVITTTRNGRNTLSSKYFHHRGERLKDKIDEMRDINSNSSRSWFYFFNDMDPCEVLRYYDGIDGCDESRLSQRIQRIASRIDCAIDTDDPDADVAMLCRAMNIGTCPQYPRERVHSGISGYWELYEIPHIKSVMEPVVAVTNMLREELLKKRCAYLFKNPYMTSLSHSSRHVLSLFPNQKCAKQQKPKRKSVRVKSIFRV